jgi:hypothetical protein
MDRVGWTDQELRGAPKGDKRKVRMAAPDDDEFEMDGGMTGDGQLDERVQPACGSESEEHDQPNKVRTETCVGRFKEGPETGLAAQTFD